MRTFSESSFVLCALLIAVAATAACEGEVAVVREGASAAVESDTGTATDEPQRVAPPTLNPICALPEGGEPAGEAPACPETTPQICQKIGFECGSTFATQGCDGPIDLVECGTCAEGFACRDGSCACPTDWECGDVTSACGGTVLCGSCDDGFACSDNRCECDREPDELICERLEIACGEVGATDFCGNDVVAFCGGCATGVCAENRCHDVLEIAPDLPEEGSLARFGYRVESAGDQVLIAAPFAAVEGIDRVGRIYVVGRSADGSFEVEQVLEPAAAIGDEEFGRRFAVGPDGNLAAVISGDHVALFERDGSDWERTGTLTAEIGPGLAFGHDISVGENFIAVGSTPSGDEPRPGRVDVWHRDGTPFTVLNAPDTLETSARFGQSVLVTRAGIWVSADRAEVDSKPGVGALYHWEDQLDADPARYVPNDPRAEQGFAHRLAFAADNVLVGSHADSDDGDESGSVYVIAREGGAWRIIQQLHAPEPTEGDRFGHALAARKNLVFVGSYATESGHVFELDLDYRFKHARAIESPADDGAWFGFRAAFLNDVLVVAAPRSGTHGAVFAQ